MNKIKLLRRLQEFFNADEKKKREKADEIEKVIEKLAVKLENIEDMLHECKDPELSKALRLEADIINAQIKKGEAVLQSFNRQKHH